MSSRFIGVVANVASAFSANNHLRAEEVPNFLASLHEAFANLDKPKEIAPDKPKPAVDLPWKKTIRPDYLVSLVDGKHYKTMRRHLAKNGLTPDEYRERYDLPRDYPMVAASYSEKRSALATAAGLGQQRQKRNTIASPAQAVEVAGATQAEAFAPLSAEADTPAPAKRKRGRPAKAAA